MVLIWILTFVMSYLKYQETNILNDNYGDLKEINKLKKDLDMNFKKIENKE